MNVEQNLKSKIYIMRLVGFLLLLFIEVSYSNSYVYFPTRIILDGEDTAVNINSEFGGMLAVSDNVDTGFLDIWLCTDGTRTDCSNLEMDFVTRTGTSEYLRVHDLITGEDVSVSVLVWRADLALLIYTLGWLVELRPP